MKNQDFTEQISKKLSALIALTLLSEVQKKTTAEKVALLIRFDLPNQEIADILGTTKGTVEVLKSRTAKKRK
jgi:DNA-binding CsgD family transcriptional regulator